VSSVHYKLSIIRRGDGKSTVAAAAYRAAERLYNHRTGLWHDFTNKGGVVHSEILLPENAPEHYHDRAILWNSVEHGEKTKNAQLSRHLEVGLPAEMEQADQINLLRDYVQEHFVERGMCADVCVHDKRDGNPHAHVMLTMRPIMPDGTWGQKSRREHILDKQGQRILLDSGKDYKTRNISLTGWDDRGNAELWRDAWEKAVNREYERLGLEQRIDMRSFEKQGLDKEPTLHLGPTAAQMEREGQPSYLGDTNREIEGRNAKKERERQSQSEPEQTHAERPSYEEWLEAHQRGQAPEREQSRGRERGR
jgi:ATP-dependent exoDNAse (exonuclease V) alpha subunit